MCRLFVESTESHYAVTKAEMQLALMATINRDQNLTDLLKNNANANLVTWLIPELRFLIGLVNFTYAIQVYRIYYCKTILVCY